MSFLRKLRRRRLTRRPFPASWSAMLEAERRDLAGLTQVFLAEKRFEGCGGLVLSDEIRVTIAAQACVLLLGRDTDIYPALRTILVYPHAYVAPTVVRGPDRAGRRTTETRRVVVARYRRALVGHGAA